MFYFLYTYKTVEMISSSDSLGDTTCIPLKAATQTKTQSQQNKRRPGVALATATMAVANSKVNVTNDQHNNNNDDDDAAHNDDDESTNNTINTSNNKHAKSYANSRRCLSQSSRQHSISRQKGKDPDDAAITPKALRSIQTSPPTTTMAARQRDSPRAIQESKINKSIDVKLMNEVHSEDQIDKTLPTNGAEENQQQQRRRQKLRQTFANKQRLPPKRTTKFQQYIDHDHGSLCSSSLVGIADTTHNSSSSSSSDSEAGHNPKLKSYLRTNGGNKPLRSTTSNSHNRSSTTKVSEKTIKTTASTLHPTGRSSITSATLKSNSERKKRDPLTQPPPVPSVTPSPSWDQLRRSIRQTPQQAHTDEYDDSNFRLSLDELNVPPLTANISDFMSVRSMETLKICNESGDRGKPEGLETTNATNSETCRYVEEQFRNK